MKTHLFKIIMTAMALGFILAFGVRAVFGAQTDAVVRITNVLEGGGHWYQGSGVCVDPSGLVLTAWHVVNKNDGNIIVSFDKKNYRVIDSYIPGTEGVVVLRIKGGDHAHLRVADVAPKVNEKLWSMGYGQGYWHSRVGTIVTKKVSIEGHPGVFWGTTIRIKNGQSGGPLVTKKWEVVGLASFNLKPKKDGDESSNLKVLADNYDWAAGFLGLQHIKSSMAAYESGKRSARHDVKRHRRAAPKRVLYVLAVGNSCPHCEKFKRDERRGLFKQYDVRYVGSKQAWVMLTGQQVVVQPAFYLAGQGNITQRLGYADAPGLIQALLKIVAGLGRVIYNRRHHDPEIGSIAPPPPRELVPIPELAPLPVLRDDEPGPSMELKELLDDVKKIKAGIEDVKEGNAISKVIAAKRLKDVLREIKADEKSGLGALLSDPRSYMLAMLSALVGERVRAFFRRRKNGVKVLGK